MLQSGPCHFVGRAITQNEAFAVAYVLKAWGPSRPVEWPTISDNDSVDQFSYTILANVRRAAIRSCQVPGVGVYYA